MLARNPRKIMSHCLAEAHLQVHTFFSSFNIVCRISALSRVSFGDLGFRGENKDVGADRLLDSERGVPSRINGRLGVEFGYRPALIGSILLDVSLAATSIIFLLFLLGVPATPSS
jgi:hypothetical protein